MSVALGPSARLRNIYLKRFYKIMKKLLKQLIKIAKKAVTEDWAETYIESTEIEVKPGELKEAVIAFLENQLIEEQEGTEDEDSEDEDDLPAF